MRYLKILRKDNHDYDLGGRSHFLNFPERGLEDVKEKGIYIQMKLVFRS